MYFYLPGKFDGSSKVAIFKSLIESIFAILLNIPFDGT